MNRWKTLLGVGLIFGLGVLSGATVLTLAPRADEQQARHRHRSFSSFLSETVVKDLDLDAAQAATILGIVKRNREDLATMREDMRPRLVEIYDGSIEDVRTALSESQKAGFERLLAERRAHRETHRKEREARAKKP